MRNRWGELVTDKNMSPISFSSNPFCFEIAKNKDLSPGQYAIIVTFTGCDGKTVTKESMVNLPDCGNGFTSPDNSDWNGDTYQIGTVYSNEEGRIDSLHSSISPNPMLDYALVNYHIPKSGHVKLALLSSNFETNKILVNEQNVQVGDYSIQINSNELMNGD